MSADSLSCSPPRSSRRPDQAPSRRWRLQTFVVQMAGETKSDSMAATKTSMLSAPLASINSESFAGVCGAVERIALCSCPASNSRPTKACTILYFNFGRRLNNARRYH